MSEEPKTCATCWFSAAIPPHHNIAVFCYVLEEYKKPQDTCEDWVDKSARLDPETGLMYQVLQEDDGEIEP